RSRVSWHDPASRRYRIRRSSLRRWETAGPRILTRRTLLGSCIHWKTLVQSVQYPFCDDHQFELIHGGAPLDADLPSCGNYRDDPRLRAARVAPVFAARVCHDPLLSPGSSAGSTWLLREREWSRTLGICGSVCSSDRRFRSRFSCDSRWIASKFL